MQEFRPALALRSSGVTITTNLTAHSFLNISYDHRRTDRMHLTAAMPLFAISTCHKHTQYANTSSSFTAGSWKLDNWMNCQPQCQKCKQNVFVHVTLIKQSYRWLCFPQVVQKQPLGQVGKWMVIWWQIVSGIFVPKIIKIWQLVFKLQSKMSVIFFWGGGHSVVQEIWAKAHETRESL